MASFNKVILLGNLTRDPETRATPSGMTICKFGIAVNRRYSTKDGEQREEVTYVDIDAFGRQAEVIDKYLSKGDSLRKHFPELSLENAANQISQRYQSPPQTQSVSTSETVVTEEPSQQQ